jgi:hypothetical protein
MRVLPAQMCQGDGVEVEQADDGGEESHSRMVKQLVETLRISTSRRNRWEIRRVL